MSKRESDELHSERPGEKQGAAKDIIKEPPHYTEHRYQRLDVTRDWLLNPWVDNAIKYICRYRYKGTPGLDLRKAAQYLEEQIKDMRSSDALSKMYSRPVFKRDVKKISFPDLCDDWNLDETMSEVMRLIYFGWFDNNIEYFERAIDGLNKARQE